MTCNDEFHLKGNVSQLSKTIAVVKFINNSTNVAFSTPLVACWIFYS